MKKQAIKSICAWVCVAASVAMFVSSCAKAEISTYDSKNKLWFTAKNKDEVVVNDIVRSFSHFPGSTSLDVPFEINLIGQILEQDAIYKVVVVDSLTTAVASEYVLPENPVFHAGQVVDTLWVKLLKSPRMDAMEVKLTLWVVENDVFANGYYNRQGVVVTFNNITTRPDWWTVIVEKAYLGTYSKEKFDAFYFYTGLNTIVGLTSSELRSILLDFKAYIAEKNITEADGSPMIIPIY